MRQLTYLSMIFLALGFSMPAGAESLARSTSAANQPGASDAPVSRDRAADPNPDARPRIGMQHMGDLIDLRIDEGVAKLNALAEKLADRAGDSTDSPGYAADWLQWRELLEELRGVYSWNEKGEPRLEAEPPRPTSEALEAHYLIEREREGLRQSRERHQVEVSEMRARGAAERAAMRTETRAPVRTSPWDIDYFHATRTIPGSGYRTDTGYGYPVWGVVRPVRIVHPRKKQVSQPEVEKPTVRVSTPHGSARSR